jgi:hypothetical protein
MSNFTPVYMSDKVYDALTGVLRQSYPAACVLYIDRVTNPALQAAYEKRVAALGSEANEKQLYHGSNAGAVAAIASGGYKAALNNRALYGPGNYFSSAASYSKDYSDVSRNGESYIIVNRVALGKHSVSVGGSYSGDSGGDGKSIYVTRHDDAALPEYVICFHRAARA